MNKSNLKLLLLAVFGVISIIGIVILAKLNVKNVENTIISRTQEHLVTIAKAQAEQIENTFEKIEQNFDIVSKVNYCGDLEVENFDASDVEQNDAYLDKVIYSQMKESISKLYRLNSEGVVQNVIPYDKYELGINYSQRADVAEVLRTRQKVEMKVPNIYQSEDVFTICQPVFRNDKLCKIYRAEISKAKIHNIVKNIKAGNHGYAWILDDQGFMISHQNTNFIGKHYILILQKFNTGNDSRIKAIMRDMLKGLSGTGLYDFVIWKNNSYKPIRKLTAYEPIEIAGHKCSIAICMGYDEISEPIKSHSRNILLAFIVLSAIFLITGILYYIKAKKQTKLQAELAISKVNEELQATTNERIEAIARLRESEELFRGIISSVPVGIFWKDTEGVYQGCNDKFIEEAGFSDSSEIIGKTDYQLKWNDYQADIFVHYDQEIIRTQLPLTNVEETIMNKAGEKKYVMMNRAPLVDPEGNVIAVVGTFMDYTNLKVVQEKAIQESITKTKMVESINHDIRVPMTSIIGFAELLEQEELTEQQAEFVKTIYYNAESLLKVIDEIVYKHPEMGHFGGTTDVISDSQKTESIEKTVKDVIEPDVGEPDNSIHKPPVEKEVSQNDPEEKHNDKGNIKDKLVNKFKKQFGDSPKIDISKQAMEVPAKILLVDDIAENRMLVETMLKKTKWEITSKSNGQQAVDAVEEEDFDVIVMDISMPVMDGIEATKAIKENLKEKPTQIIAMTAYESREDEIECLDAGFDDFLAKPVKKENLLKKICRAINHVNQLKEAEKGLDITSFLEDEDDYKKAVEMFVENLPDRVRKMQYAIENNDLDELKAAAHALKGLGSFAGFPIYTEMAKAIELTIGENDIEKVREEVEDLAKLCMRTKLKNK
jgi:PAS domain S-box-containing protein